MALIIEDGTGVAGANSYVSLAFVNQYFVDRNITAWAALSSTVQGAAVIAATDYMDGRFGPNFRSDKQFPLIQSLEFPRTAFAPVPPAAVALPLNLMKATAEYALRAAAAVLAPDLVSDPTGYGVQRDWKEVGPIRTQKQYAIQGPGSRRNFFSAYPAADMLLNPFTRTPGVIRN